MSIDKKEQVAEIEKLRDTIVKLYSQIEGLGWSKHSSVMIHDVDLKLCKEIWGDDLVVTSLFIEDGFRSQIVGKLRSISGVDLFSKDYTDDDKNEDADFPA